MKHLRLSLVHEGFHLHALLVHRFRGGLALRLGRSSRRLQLRQRALLLLRRRLRLRLAGLGDGLFLLQPGDVRFDLLQLGREVRRVLGLLRQQRAQLLRPLQVHVHVQLHAVQVGLAPHQLHVDVVALLLHLGQLGLLLHYDLAPLLHLQLLGVGGGFEHLEGVLNLGHVVVVLLPHLLVLLPRRHARRQRRARLLHARALRLPLPVQLRVLLLQLPDLRPQPRGGLLQLLRLLCRRLRLRLGPIQRALRLGHLRVRPLRLRLQLLQALVVPQKCATPAVLRRQLRVGAGLRVELLLQRHHLRARRRLHRRRSGAVPQAPVQPPLHGHGVPEPRGIVLDGDALAVPSRRAAIGAGLATWRRLRS
mmetsp:Transcript_46171/g.88101  ORF Transcript_46171/g.88101 Transcript_46171/m.88101 type:complete len:364 (-) Transcript_46171:660-1751(-)